jgi:hypothetical protein
MRRNLLLAIASCHAYLAGMTLVQADYSVVVKRRAPPPKAWRWEIYRAGRTSPIVHSSVYFQTMTMASRAAQEDRRTIDYVATGSAGLTSKTTHTVIIEAAPSIVPSADA